MGSTIIIRLQQQHVATATKNANKEIEEIISSMIVDPNNRFSEPYIGQWDGGGEGRGEGSLRFACCSCYTSGGHSFVPMKAISDGRSPIGGGGVILLKARREATRRH